eukprot:jgi/Botrbrau1/432/Bobra.110_2s0082.1
MAERKRAPDDALWNDLAARFINTIPLDNFTDKATMMYCIESAHWFYQDSIQTREPDLRSYSFEQFAAQLLAHTPGLKPYAETIREVNADFKKHKLECPSAYVILLNKDLKKCLLVRGVHANSGWTFPGGKCQKMERPIDAAVREMKEETGLDVRQLINETDMLFREIKGQANSMYIVPGVDESTLSILQPQCRGEIGGYGWYRVSELPDEHNSPPGLDANGRKLHFYKVWPFMKGLKRWIDKRQKSEAEQRRQERKQRREYQPGVPASPLPLRVQAPSPISPPMDTPQFVRPSRGRESVQLLEALQNGNPIQSTEALQRLRQARNNEASAAMPINTTPISLSRGGFAADIERALHQPYQNGSPGMDHPSPQGDGNRSPERPTPDHREVDNPVDSNGWSPGSATLPDQDRRVLQGFRFDTEVIMKTLRDALNTPKES